MNLWPRLACLVALLVLTACNRNEEPDFSPAEREIRPESNAGARGGNAATKIGAPARPSGIPAPADVAAPPAEATRTESGLAYLTLVPGTGSRHPEDADRVSVNYTGWTTDGQMFDSSITRGQAATFGVSQVIAGWTEMLKLMTAGQKVRVWIPEDLAYRGRPGAPAGMLVFEVELIGILGAPQAPEDVAAPPADAEATESGLRSKVLRPGTGHTRPTTTSRVRVHYTGWTTDGNMFDSSLTRGQPAVFPLNRVIQGWTEGLQLMVVGEKRRFWIPEELAYQGRAGAPQGMLVFDVELLEIMD